MANTYSVGSRVGDYQVIEVLGAGGFGEVYKVRNVLSERVEALKVLLPSHLGDSTLTDRFLREIKVQATLEHPNIARLLGVQSMDDRILMFLEFIDGTTLENALNRGPLSPGTTASIAAQVLDALSYAHSRGVVHRDIKPANIMIQRDGGIKLMDFGIARLGQDRKLTSTGQVLGTLHYMSPEQINALPDLDERTDLYSLGIVMYFAMTGNKPFDGPSDFSIMAGHLNTLPPPPIQINPLVPVALNEVVLKGVEKDRARRYQTAREFRQALDQAMGGRYPVVEVAMDKPAAAKPANTEYPTVPIPRAAAPVPSPTVTNAGFTGPVPPQAPTPSHGYAAAPPAPAPPTPSHGYAAPPQPPPTPSHGYAMPSSPPPAPSYSYAPPPPPPPSMQQPQMIYVNVAQNAQASAPQQSPATMMDSLTAHAIRSQLGHKSPILGAILGFCFPWAGALYVAKPGMAFLLFCAEVAVGTVSCAASCTSRSSDPLTGGSLIEFLFHGFAAWQCFKWATFRNLQTNLMMQVPMQQQQQPPPPQMYR